jgi:PAS domain S-box-containing protein
VEKTHFLAASPVNSVQPHNNFDNYYRQMVQDLPVAIYTCDHHGFISYFNNEAVKLWGRTPDIGTDLWCGSWKIFDTDGNPVSLNDCPMALTLKESRPIRGVEIVVERPDGKRVNVLPHPDPILNENGELVGAVNMLVDITEHKQAREANILLNYYNNQLEEFAYAASHDLQEPLRKIHAFSSLLLENCSCHLDERGKLYLGKITESASRMSSLIHDLLNFSKESKNNDLFSVTDLNRIIENIKTDLELLITSKNAIINVDPLPLIRSLPSQINRLFFNLLHNALKFSRDGVPPVISITISEHLFQDQGRLFLEINFADNGIGFDEKYSEKIFQLFQRLNDRHSYPGNGIGLALCKKIMENHDGSIAVSSKPQNGTIFSLRLPVELVLIG